MTQIIEQIETLRTPLALNSFVNGRTVSITRDNKEDVAHFGKEVSLYIYDRKEIAGGKSTYQIAQQPVYPAKNKMLNSRRGDLVLLISSSRKVAYRSAKQPIRSRNMRTKVCSPACSV